jgi:pyruvate/2-oxoglutarate dehydrogenase complex dihydrolipoamide dehydrogenase (E3) component
MENLFGGMHKAAKYDAVPWAIFTWPQVGHVGITEREAKEKGIRYGVARNSYSARGVHFHGHHGKIRGQRLCEDHLAARREDIGAHIAGPYASMLVQPFVYLMNAGTPCPDLSVTGGFRRGDCPKMAP